jgi:hypothetical protein
MTRRGANGGAFAGVVRVLAHSTPAHSPDYTLPFLTRIG